MSELLECVNQRINKLKQVIQEKQESLENAPEGVLNICRTEKRIQYYHKLELPESILSQEEASITEEEAAKQKKVYRKYLKNTEKQIVADLCQKDYNQQVLRLAQNELQQLEKIKSNYPTKLYEDVYEQLPVYRQNYVQPVRLSDEMFICNWQQIEFKRKGFREDAPEFYTDRGERVRSKTEILIANALSKYHIPYHYEKPVYLNGYGMVHPDFTALNIRLRKEFYWEHMGMLDDPDYMEDAFRKITMYEKNDIFPGDKLILTHETLKYPINPQNIDKMIRQYLI